MVPVFVITESEHMRSSLARYLRRVWPTSSVHTCTPSQPRENSNQWITETFDSLADWMEACARQDSDTASLRQVVAFIDLLHAGEVATLQELNPIAVSPEPWSR